MSSEPRADWGFDGPHTASEFPFAGDGADGGPHWVAGGSGPLPLTAVN